MIVISLDGVKDTVFEYLAHNPATCPNIAEFKSRANYIGGVKTIFVSNTYPIHTTISTGRLPREHGIISNLINEEKNIWAQDAVLIKSKTIWQAAKEKGLSVATILWPVTCSAKIKYNLPEVHLTAGQNQIIENFKNGSALFQIKAFLKHGKKMKGLEPICLDDFTSSVAADLLNKQKPDLTLIHLLAYDFTSHDYGSKSEEVKLACKSLDQSVGKILAAAGGQTVLMFSDHGHFDVDEVVNLKSIYKEELYEQCGGSAFFSKLPKDIELQPWFERFLTAEEMETSGYSKYAAGGIAAKVDYCFAKGNYKSNHGYPADYPDYNVFYAVAGAKRTYNPIYNDVRDITVIIDKELNLGLL